MMVHKVTMELFSVKTRSIQPPKDNLLAVFDEFLPKLLNRDVIIVTSKVIAIHEGRCIPVHETDKKTLILKEAEYVYTDPETGKLTTVTRNAFISASGIDESNGDGFYTLLPEDSFSSAKQIWEYLCKKHQLSELGVIITDSHSVPLRFGALSVGIGCWGIQPVESHIGRKDLFGREIRYSKTNITDSLAASATLVSGECNESTPIVIARDVPNLVFTNTDPKKEFLVPLEEDFFSILFERFKKGGRKM